MNNNLKNRLKNTTVIPVLVIENIEDAVPLALALSKGGLKTLEITLRTDNALEALSEIKKALPEILVGAGTVLNPENLEDALHSGADFLVSPGITPALLSAAKSNNAPFLPGASTPSEMLQLLGYGFSFQKFFPAEASGGVDMLKAISGPIPQITFCPTGGISLLKAGKYLSCNNVSCVGGSWMARSEWIMQKNWQQIEDAARETSNLTNSKYFKSNS